MTVPPGYERTQYLNVLHSINIPSTTANSDIVACAVVPQGQYWSPKIVRVSLLSPGPAVGGVQDVLLQQPPAGALFYGVPQKEGISSLPVPNVQLGLYLDGTVSSNGDASGVVSGMSLAPGEALTFVWRNVSAPLDLNGDKLTATAILQILGTVSNVPPNVDITTLPETMGAHFQGKPSFATPPEATLWAPGIVPHRGPGFAFSAPGPGNTVVVLADLPPSIKLFSMSWCWTNGETGANQRSGFFAIQTTAPLLNDPILTYDTALNNVARYCDFAGLRVDAFTSGHTNLVFVEDASSSLVANGPDCTGMLAFAAIVPQP